MRALTHTHVARVRECAITRVNDDARHDRPTHTTEVKRLDHKLMTHGHARQQLQSHTLAIVAGALALS